MSWKSRTFDGPLPALAVRGPELRKSLRIVTLAYMYATVHIACVTGSQVNVFGEMLGFNDFAFGLLTAIPYLAAIAQIVAALPVDRTGLRKHQFILFQSTARFGWIGVAAIGLLLPLPSRTAVVLVLALYTVMCVLDASAAPAWWTWMADLIPRRIRGRYMATREAWSNVSRLVSFVAVGVILELATDHAKLHPGQPASVAQQPLLFHTICGLFIVGGIFGATVLMFYRVREILPPVHSSPPGGAAATIPTPIEGQAAGPYTLLRALRSSLVEPWSDRLFRRFTTFYTALNVSTAMCAIYVWRIALNHVGFSEPLDEHRPDAGGRDGLAADHEMGRAGDRPFRAQARAGRLHGNGDAVDPVLRLPGKDIAGRRVCPRDQPPGRVRGRVAGPRRFAPIQPGAPVVAYGICCVMAAVGGIAWSGVTLAQTSFMLHFSGAGGKGKHVAAFWVITSLGGLVGGLAGGILTQSLEFLQTTPITLGPLRWSNWHVAVLASCALRLGSVLLLADMPDPGARRCGRCWAWAADAGQASLRAWYDSAS